MAHAVEDAAEDVRRDGQFQAVAEKADLAVLDIDAERAFKKLDQGIGAVDLEDLAAADFTVGQLDFAQFVVFDTARPAGPASAVRRLHRWYGILWAS